MSNDAAPDQSSADGYLQRAQLLAELGRYDEAAAELGYAVALDPGNPLALTMLAQVHLAAGRPAEARTAAESAVAAVPHFVPALVTRALALVDLGEYAEAARTADEILTLGPNDAYAQRSAAAILAGARNGQPALNAAWRGVELAPEEPQAHLVLGLVAARLELFDLAERAYREALRLDPQLAEARHDMGVLRLEQRRYAEALEHLAEAAAMSPGRVDSRRTISDGLRRLVLYGAGWSLVATVLVACLAAGNGAMSRFFAAAAALGGGLLVWRYAAKLPGLTSTILPGLLRSDRPLAVAVYAVAAAPALILLYALFGTPWPLVLAIAVTAVAQLAVYRRPVA
ncbi:tetratricopeptide repeat protein [Micromonospora fluostatini]|uniref:Tetratricopeptide repeat protein n=1 Tax=Micromonospora fluostatini TaxID=1629071 RepID=A0ABY2DLH0_9ACTN|nr:tetratricopeptide repeat protein [Micromonospora fluostatini]